MQWQPLFAREQAEPIKPLCCLLRNGIVTLYCNIVWFPLTQSLKIQSP